MLEQPYLVVDPLVVARRLGVEQPTPFQHDLIVDAIIDAQDAVVAEINRPIQPRRHVVTQVWPKPGALDLDDSRSWPLEGFDDTVSVVSRTASPFGSYDLEVAVGLDGAAERPIVRYVVAHAAAALRESGESGMGQRVITSLAAEGQSVSYAALTTAGAKAAGAPPDLGSLRAYKRHAVGKANRGQRAPWPYDGNPLGYEP